MTGNAKLRAASDDRNSPDHFPTCPECDGLCPTGQKWSECCGVWLLHRLPTKYEQLDNPHRHALESRPVTNGDTLQAARERGA